MPVLTNIPCFRPKQRMVEMKIKSTCQYLSRSFVQERSWPFSRLQTMVTWFVKVEAAKMTDVIDGLCREKGQVLETDRTGRMRTGVCQVVPGLWCRELGNGRPQICEIQSTTVAPPCPMRSEHGRLPWDRQPLFWVPPHFSRQAWRGASSVVW